MKLRLCVTALCAVTLWSEIEAVTKKFENYQFEAYVAASSGRYSEVTRNGHQYLLVREGDEYSIVVKNPMPVRVAVAVTVDGLNTIDGKRTSAKKAQKWVIEANSSLSLRGWQTSDKALRRFVFTKSSESYASWKESQDNRAHTRNLGVIGVAYFWNSSELQLALNPPRPFDDDMEKLSEAPLASSASRAESYSRVPSAQSRKKAQTRAGTGMGSRESNVVTEVEFRYDSGMYANKDVLAIFYEFAKDPPLPLPFDDEGEYVPEMSN